MEKCIYFINKHNYYKQSDSQLDGNAKYIFVFWLKSKLKNFYHILRDKQGNILSLKKQKKIKY